ncbi:MAG: hypothetical protein C0507_23215 [Cyanobacteria bacterium PR.3.49]|nr:hypothetical protein [Cyanobacteria bacterium PR.3.49]
MAEKNLHVLLSSISPWLHDETYVFCTVSDKQFRALKTEPICFFRESEGVSIIVEQSAADAAVLAYDGTWSLITCEVDSDLNAVGFIAAMSKIVAEAGISINPVSAYHHDHLFVPSDRAQDALALLQEAPMCPLPTRQPITDIRDLIPLVFSEQKAVKAPGSLLTQGIALIRSKFGYTLPDDMKLFYERCADVKVFDRYSIISLQRAMDIDRSMLPQSWLPFCEMPNGKMIAIDLSEPNDHYPIIDLDNNGFDYIVIALSFTEFIDKILSHSGDSIYWIDHSEQAGTVNVHLSNKQLRQKHKEYWDSLGDTTKGERCLNGSCDTHRISLSVFCKKHQFEQIAKIECPFTTDKPRKTFAEYTFD